MARLNLSQRVVILIGLGAALYVFGEWTRTLGSHPAGWIATRGYKALVFAPGGLDRWAQLLIWLALLVIWVVASALVLRSSRNGTDS